MINHTSTQFYCAHKGQVCIYQTTSQLRCTCVLPSMLVLNKPHTIITRLCGLKK